MEKHKNRVVLVGGGSGGHFYPLISIAEVLTRQPAPEAIPALYYMGPTPYDTEALNKLAITYRYCPAGKQRRYRSFRNTLDLFKVMAGVCVALVQLFRIYPDVVMSKGGYTSVPVVFAAWLLRIPVVLHESDAVPGRANKFCARFATYIGIAYPDIAEFFPEKKTAYVGVPMRTELLDEPTTEGRAELGLHSERSTLLVIGGSQGAERINELILESLDELLPQYNVIHQTGADLFDTAVATAQSLITQTSLLEYYHPVAFMPPQMLNEALHAASVVISRAGSGSIYEIAAHGKPSILIPIPEDVSHDQRTNAYAYARTGAAVVMEERNLQDGLLAAEIGRIMGDQQMYGHMSTAARSFGMRDAAETIAATLVRIAVSHH
ncbi:UDP-N-acetylglucosamine--N-acetylmuramyl-(pentapeptide) pyrophosphoryl-undecaprenol N-acetylglucosamine transferase [Candidatus Kaiserbacteria bacterium]|nr:UDP-N-acetylglucosamine--N-acetylmuramyl-(pentapeptide) pyrophosphoryl-undecaprenol N-acetylglucosamine transferase [Candidatus Kaiserbacteria bacterium]